MFDFIITTIIPSIHVDIPTNVKKPPDICLIDIPILMLVFYGFSILSFHGFFPLASSQGTCGPAEVDAQFPPSSQTRQQLRWAKRPVTVGDFFGEHPLKPVIFSVYIYIQSMIQYIIYNYSHMFKKSVYVYTFIIMLIYDLDDVSYLTFCIFRMNGCNPIPYYKATQHGGQNMSK